MNHSAEMKHLPAALLKAQGAIQPARKDSVNPHFKSKYADLASVWDACRDALQEAGLVVVQLPVEGEPGRCTLVTRLFHTSGEYIESTASVKLTKDDPQGYGSALTYLRRYMLMAFLGITPDDDDGHAASRPPQAKPQEKPQGNGNNKRAEMCRRITKLEQEIEMPIDGLRCEIIGGTGSLDEASEEKLKEYGIALKNLMPEKEGQE
jgi:hypothetical protein